MSTSLPASMSAPLSPAFRPWWRGYQRADLLPDIKAGLTVGVVLVPQSLAYSLLAGVPPSAGLYASLLPVLVYALLGTSKHLAVGPVALDSLLVAEAARLVAVPGSPEYLGAATLLAAMVGVLQLALGALRAGFLANFLSRPVLSGFTSAAALLIAGSQLSHLFVVAQRGGQPWTDISALSSSIHWVTAGVGLSVLAFVYAAQKWKRTFPAALVGVLVACLADMVFVLGERGVALIGEIPNGLPAITLPHFSLDLVKLLVPSAFTIAFVGFTETASVGKTLAAKHGYDVLPNRELLALGAANLTSSLSGGFPVAGGLSRSAVSEQSGSRSQLAAVLSAAVVLLTLLFLTPLFAHLPKAALAGIVIVSAIGLVDYREPLRLWRVRRADAALLAVAFVLTLTLGVVQGVIGGTLLGVALFVQRSTRPHTVELGRLPGTNVFRNPRNFPEAQPVPGVLILRMDASFYFGNVQFFRDRLDDYLRSCARSIRVVLLDASSMNDLDSSAEQTLRDVTQRLRALGKDVVLANVKGPVRDVMRRSGFWDYLGADHFFLDLASAVDAIGERSARGESDLETA